MRVRVRRLCGGRGGAWLRQRLMKRRDLHVRRTRGLRTSGQARCPAASSAAGSAAWLGGISRRRRSPGAAMRPAGRRAARSHGRAGRARRQGGRGAVCVHRSADNSPWWRLLLLPKLVPLVRLLLSRPHAP